MKRRFVGLAAVLLLATPQPAQAESPDATPAQIAEAQARFRRAIELHDEGNLDAARVELRRAYEVAPNYKVLFNLGQIEFEMLDYPAALATFEKYLREGGDQVPKDRRVQVQHDIEKLRGRLGSIEIAVNVPDSIVAVDDVTVGTTPLLQPVVVSAGRRRVIVSHSGYTTETRLIDVTGGDHGAMSFELVEAPHTGATVAAVPIEGAPSSPIETPATPEPAPQRSVPWVGWAATALLAAGAGITGGLALQRSQTLASERGRYGANRSELDELEKAATNFAVASDIFAGAAAFTGIVSFYLTVAPSSKSEQARSVRVAPSLGFVSVQGAF